MIAFFYDLFYILPLSLALILNLIGLGMDKRIFVTGTDGYSMMPLTGCLASSGLIVLILLLRHLGRKERAFAAGIIAVVCTSLFFILGREKRMALYDRYTWIIAIICISLLSIIVGKFSQKLSIVKICVGVILLSDCIYMMISKITCPKGMVGISFAIVMIYLLEMIQRRWHKSGYTDIKSHVAYIAPIIIILCTLVSLIPFSTKAYDWAIARNIWKAGVSECKRIVGMISADKEEYGYSGFSDNGEVEAGVAANNREVMLVTLDHNAPKFLYLSGISYETFDGQSWKVRSYNDTLSRDIDFIETKTAISQYDNGYERDLGCVYNVKLVNRLYNTHYLFLPDKTNMHSSRTQIPEYDNSDSRLITKDKLGYGDSYSISYLTINYTNSDLAMLIDNAPNIDRQAWNHTLKTLGLDTKKKDSYDSYLKYRDEIYARYGGNKSCKMEAALEYSDMSDEVKDIVRELLSSARQSDNNEKEGSYSGDYERLMAVAEYLQTMQYNRMPGALPGDIDDGRSFLDYFLLESRSGFCIHYATSFTLLARQLGYPARYVQGYKVKKSKGDEIVVTQDNAHAWSEVYFDNFGWVIFEVTPGYSGKSGWEVQGKVDFKNENRERVSTHEEVAEVEAEEIIVEENKLFSIGYFLIPVLCAFLFGIIYFLASRILGEKRFERMDDKAKGLVLIEKSLRVLRLMGYPLGVSETIAEYEKRICQLEGMDRKWFFLTLYEQIIYANYVILPTDIIVMKEEYEMLRVKCRTKGIRYKLLLLLT